MKKKLIAPIALLATVGAAGAAFALLGGFVNVPNAVEGLAQGPGTSGCQTSSVNFEIPDPVWDASTTSWVVLSVDYAGITTACVNLGTADHDLRIVNGNTTLASATATNMGATSGTMTLTPVVDFDALANADFVYLVKG